MIRIGLISDTHGTFDDAVRRFLEPVEQIWHAGDIAIGYGRSTRVLNT